MLLAMVRLMLQVTVGVKIVAAKFWTLCDGRKHSGGARDGHVRGNVKVDGVHAFTPKAMTLTASPTAYWRS